VKEVVWPELIIVAMLRFTYVRYGVGLLGTDVINK